MSIIDKFKNPKKDVRGFDGMMMLFTVALAATAVGYLISMYRSYFPYFLQSGFHFSTQSAQIYNVFRTYEFFGYVLIVLSFIAIAVLVALEKPIVKKLVNILMPLSVIILILSYFIGAKITKSPLDFPFFMRLLQSLIIPVSFLIYMNKSIRVRNTFVNNTEVDYVKMAKEYKKKQKKGKDSLWDRAKDHAMQLRSRSKK